MKDNRDELILIDGEYYSHQELVAFIESNRELAQRCERQTRFIKALKLDNSKLTIERNELQEANRKLKKEYNDFYEKDYMVRIDECNRLWGELEDIKHLSMWEFADKYCSDSQMEEDAKLFARELLGKTMTEADIAEEEFIANGEAHYERTWNLNGGDDF